MTQLKQHLCLWVMLNYYFMLRSHILFSYPLSLDLCLLHDAREAVQQGNCPVKELNLWPDRKKGCTSNCHVDWEESGSKDSQLFLMSRAVKQSFRWKSLCCKTCTTFLVRLIVEGWSWCWVHYWNTIPPQLCRCYRWAIFREDSQDMCRNTILPLYLSGQL